MSCSSSGTITATCIEPTSGFGEKVFVYRSAALGDGTYRLFSFNDIDSSWTQIGTEVRPAGSATDASTLGAVSAQRNSDIDASKLASGKAGFESFMSGAVTSGGFDRSTNFVTNGSVRKKSVSGGGEMLQFGTESALFGGSLRSMLFGMVESRISGQPMEFVTKDCSGEWKAQVSVSVIGIIDGDSGSTQFLKTQGDYGKLYK